MFARAENELPSSNPSRKTNVPQQQHPRNKKLKMISSFRGFILLSIAASVNFMIVSTFFDVNKHRNTSFASGGRRSLPMMDGSAGDERETKIRILSSSTSESTSPTSKLNENIKKNSTSAEEKLKISIKSTLTTLSTSNLEQAEDILSINNLATTTATTRSKDSSFSPSTPFVPYYLKGKTRYKRQKFHRKKTFDRITQEEAEPVNPSQKVWVLPDPVKIPTRNHESILLEYKTSEGAGEQVGDKQILVNILGRYSRGVQWMDLETGEQRSMETKGNDPDQRPLNDLNHVASVLVDSLEQDGNERTKKEVWLPCGFHNDPVGKELSSNYVRIVDLETMEVRTGPKLPYSGGACGAAPIEAVPGEPPLVCAFGGTNGNHDTGIFLPYVSCYDRVVNKWVYPFGRLPVGMDHLSVVVVPKAACNPEDPARVLVFNFRTKNYSTHTSAEILAFDIPSNGWTREELEKVSADQEGGWYTFAKHSFDGGEDEAYAPRDASGVVMANGGRSVVNFGGINQVRNPLWKKGDRSKGPKVFSTWYSTVRELDVCAKNWEKVADLGIQTFALMASASTELNTAFFCGGSMSRNDFKGNTQLCLAIRIPGLEFWNHRKAAVENFPEGFQAGGRVGAKASLATTDGIGINTERN